ncbi:hypothetical protein [Microbacterium sp. P02]|uniref:hypothetical protein n=1 Tax=Microbacterium sp. P02 TaxID=3366260 RepID=UPI003672DE55
MTLAGSTTPSSVDELQARLDRLEAENARLRADAPRPATRTGPPGTGWRAVLSAFCIIVAALLIPTTIIAGWARAQLVDETAFVSTFAPLIDDPSVQAVIVDQASSAITESVDLDGITDDLFDGVATLDLPPAALSSIDLLRGPAAQALDGLVTTTVSRVVASDAFSGIWQTTLVASHRALVATANGGSANGAVTISDSGELGIALGPIVDAVKQRLLDQGVGFASAIPTIDRTIVIAQSDALATVGVVYTLAVTVGWWLPFVVLALFVTGILIARRRSTAVLGSGVGLALGGLSVATGIAVGGTVLGLSATNLGVPATALTAVYTAVVAAMQHTAVVVMVVGIIIALLAWVSGRWRGARAVRGGIAAVNDSIRSTLTLRGVNTGRFGTWMFQQRVLVRVVLGVLMVLWLLLLRPLSVGDIFLVVIVSALVWWLTELVQKRDAAFVGDAPATIDADAADVPRGALP